MEWLNNRGYIDEGLNTCDDISRIERICLEINIPYDDEIIRIYNYHNQLIYEFKNINVNIICIINNYNDLLRWYYKDVKTTLFRQINLMTYKDNIV